MALRNRASTLAERRAIVDEIEALIDDDVHVAALRFALLVDCEEYFGGPLPTELHDLAWLAFEFLNALTDANGDEASDEGLSHNTARTLRETLEAMNANLTRYLDQTGRKDG